MSRDYTHAPRSADAEQAEELAVPEPELATPTPHALPVPGVARAARPVARKAGAGGASDPLGGTEAGAGVVAALQRRRGKGSPLPTDVARRFGKPLGVDLSGVNVHTDGEADGLSREVGATAFTHGSDVYFTKGTYNPGSAAGQRLLAHELAHVAQNASGKFAQAGGTTIGRADDPAEAAADSTADRVITALQRTTATPAESDLEAASAEGAGALRRLTTTELIEMHEAFIEAAGGGKGPKKKQQSQGEQPSQTEAKVEGGTGSEGGESQSEEKAQGEQPSQTEAKVEGGTGSEGGESQSEEKAQGEQPSQTEAKVEGGTGSEGGESQSEEKAQGEQPSQTEAKVEGGTGSEGGESQSEEKAQGEQPSQTEGGGETGTGEEIKAEGETGSEGGGETGTGEEIKAEGETGSEAGGEAGTGEENKTGEEPTSGEEPATEEENKTEDEIDDELEMDPEVAAGGTGPDPNEDDLGDVIAGAEQEQKEKGAGDDKDWLAAAAQPDAKAEANSAQEKLAQLIPPHLDRIATYWQLIQTADNMPSADSSGWADAAAKLGAEIKAKVKTAGDKAVGQPLGAQFGEEIAGVSDFAVLVSKLQNEHWRCVEYLKRQDFPVHNDGSMDGPKTAGGDYDFSKREIKYNNTPEEQETAQVTFRNGRMYRDSKWVSDEEEEALATKPGKSAPAKPTGPRLVDTNASVTEKEGLHWEMFVVSRDGSWYMDSQKLGLTEHSSLVGGTEAAMGGEVRVRNGKIEELTNKSGAYVAALPDVMNVLVSISSQGAVMNFPVSGFGLESGKTAAELLEEQGLTGKVNPQETYNGLLKQEPFAPVIKEFGAARLLNVIEDEGWRTDGKSLFNSAGAKVSMAQATATLALKPEERFEEIKSASGWSQLVTQFGETRLIQVIGAENWHAEGGSVLTKEGEKIAPADAAEKLKVDPSVTLGAIKKLSGWTEPIRFFQKESLLAVIAAKGWHVEEEKVLDGKGNALSLTEAAPRLKVDANVTYNALKDLSDDWRDLVKYFGKERVIAVIDAKGWRVQDGTVVDGKGEKVTTDDARTKLRGKPKKTLAQEDEEKEDLALGLSTDTATQAD